MKENNKGSMIILTIIGIATLLIAVIGATFAYFTVTVKYKTAPSQVEVKSNTMVIEYEALNNIEYYGQELITETYNLTRMNLVMKDIKTSNIFVRNGDTLSVSELV